MDGVDRNGAGLNGCVGKGDCTQVVVGTFTIAAKFALAVSQPLLNAGRRSEQGGSLVLHHRLLMLVEPYQRPAEQLACITGLRMFQREAFGQPEGGQAIRLHQSDDRFSGLCRCRLQDHSLGLAGGERSSPGVRRCP